LMNVGVTLSKTASRMEHKNEKKIDMVAQRRSVLIKVNLVSC
jgi:hypothetical protein